MDSLTFWSNAVQRATLTFSYPKHPNFLLSVLHPLLQECKPQMNSQYHLRIPLCFFQKFTLPLPDMTVAYPLHIFPSLQTSYSPNSITFPISLPLMKNFKNWILPSICICTHFLLLPATIRTSASTFSRSFHFWTDFSLVSIPTTQLKLILSIFILLNSTHSLHSLYLAVWQHLIEMTMQSSQLSHVIPAILAPYPIASIWFSRLYILFYTRSQCWGTGSLRTQSWEACLLILLFILCHS